MHYNTTQHSTQQITDTKYSTVCVHCTYATEFGLVYFGTMSQQNRKAFMVSCCRCKHESCEPILIQYSDNYDTTNAETIQKSRAAW